MRAGPLTGEPDRGTHHERPLRADEPLHLLTLITGALIVLALRLLGTQAPVMVAAAAQGQPSEGQVVRIPRDWGRLAGVSERRLFFEAEVGTIRQMPVLCAVCTFFRN